MPLFRSMTLKVASVVDILPPRDSLRQEDVQAFGSAVTSPNSLGKRRRAEEDSVQREDALKRRVVWVSTDLEWAGEEVNA